MLNNYQLISGLVPQPVQYPVQQVPMEYFIYSEVTKCSIKVPPSTFKFDAITGLAIAPVGYTALYFPATTTTTTVPTLPTLAPPTPVNMMNLMVNNNPVNQISSSMSSENLTDDCSRDNSRASSEAGDSEDFLSRKYPHKSKQNRIKQVYDEIKEYFTKEGCYAASEKEVLRGMDTCRIHVKNFAGLNKILEILQEVHAHPQVQFLRIATPISKKNKFQMKGFIVYMKLVDEKMVPFVQEIFSKYTHLYKKCDIAKTREQTALEKAQKTATSTTIKTTSTTEIVKHNKLENHTVEVLNRQFLTVPNLSVTKVSNKTVTINGLVARNRTNFIAPCC